MIPRIARWALELENYQYNIKHRPETNMANVDALSRNIPIGLINADKVDTQLQASS